MESISAFVTMLVTTLILMTAVELIAPDNSMKKYINFVLGLILISVMLAPIVSFFSSGEVKIISEIGKYEKEITKMHENENEEVGTSTDESFKKNLDENCNRLLQEEFKGIEFKSDISCNMDLKNLTYSIEKVEVGVKDNSIKKIQKIEIDTEKSNKVIDSKNEEDMVSGEEEIKLYLEQILSIEPEKIEIYRLEE